MDTYHISSHDYLDRALKQLESDSPASWFYAAFELRCGIEVRMSEYLEVWGHISKKKKKGWRIAEMHRNVEEAFRIGNKIIRWAVHNRADDSLIICLYHTPVTTKLKNDGERLGNYLHSMKKLRAPNDAWWVRFRAELTDTAARLRTATTGTLLGPPLVKLGTKNVDMKMELPPGVKPAQVMAKIGDGSEVKIRVSYLGNIPSPIEPEALTWWTGS